MFRVINVQGGRLSHAGAGAADVGRWVGSPTGRKMYTYISRKHSPDTGARANNSYVNTYMHVTIFVQGGRDLKLGPAPPMLTLGRFSWGQG